MMPIGPYGEPLPYPDQAQPQPPPAAGDFKEIVRRMLTEGRMAADLAPSDQDTLLIEQANSLLAKLLAGIEKDLDAGMGGKMTPQMLRR